MGEAETGDLQALAESPTLAVDLLPSLFEDQDDLVRENAMSTYARRVYRAHNILDVSKGENGNSLTWKFKFRTYPDDSPARTGLLITAKNISRSRTKLWLIFGAVEGGARRRHGSSGVAHCANRTTRRRRLVVEDGPNLRKAHRDELKAINVKFVNCFGI